MAELEMISTFINTVGFPAAAFAGMYYLVVKIISANTKALQDLEKTMAVLMSKKE